MTVAKSLVAQNVSVPKSSNTLEYPKTSGITQKRNTATNPRK